MASEVSAQEFVHQLEHGKGRWWIAFGLILMLAGVLFTSFLFIHVLRAMSRNDQPMFRGLNNAKGMEQACVARELARGNGYSTKVIKPAGIELINSKKGEGTFSDLVNGNTAISKNMILLATELARPRLTVEDVRGMLEVPASERGGKYSPKAQALLSEMETLFQMTPEQRSNKYGRVPDISNAPLGPWLNSVALRTMVALNQSFKWRVNEEGQVDFWRLGQSENVYIADQTIAGLAILLFYAAIILNYFTIAWLFDRRLSAFMVVITLVCEHFWNFAGTGLPQILLLFLFSGAMLCLTRSLMAQTGGRSGWPWVAGAGVLFGLMALAHPLSLFVTVGAVLFVGTAVTPKKENQTADPDAEENPVLKFFSTSGARSLGILLIVAAIFVPWLMRNAEVCGDFRGLSWQSRLFEIRGSESQIMRTLKEPDETVQPVNFGVKVMGETLGQFDKIYYHLGKVPMALFFFLALLHNFKRRETRVLRRGLIFMWLPAVFGMAFFGFADYDLLAKEQSNDLHLIFIPFFGAYGLALILNLWSRLEVDGHLLSNIKILDGSFIVLVINASALPMWTHFLTPNTLPFSFPPYYPPAIARTGQWFTERDVICTDMPWGVAWYGDRRSLWLPLAKRDFVTLNTFTFDGRVNGLFLTPISGYRGLQTDIDGGEFRDWSLFIRHDRRLLDQNARVADALPFNVVNDEIFIMGARNYVLYADRDRWSDRQ